jgi:ATP-dependent helicase HrpA
MIRDRFRFRRALNKNHNHASLKSQIQKSVSLAEARAKSMPKPVFPEQLPVSQRLDDIQRVLSRHQVIIIAGETGSGKTTQLPKICLTLGRGIYGVIGHTQPRRVAARTVAHRIAEELKVSVGGSVGYQVRFTDRTSNETHIKVMTDGILLAETQQDRFLEQYDTLIIDV